MYEKNGAEEKVVCDYLAQREMGVPLHAMTVGWMLVGVTARPPRLSKPTQ